MKRRSAHAGMWKLLGPYRGSIAWISCLTVIQSLLQVVMAVLMKFVIDAALTGGGKLIFWGAALAADLVLLVGVHSLLSWCAGSAMDKMVARLRYELLSAAAYSKGAKLQAYHSGELLSRGMEDVNTVCDGAMNAMPVLAGQITKLVGSFAAILVIYPPLAAVLLAAALLIGGVVAWLRPVIKRRQRQVRQTEEQVLSGMQEDLQQLELIQSLEIQAQTLKRFDARLEKNLLARFNRRVWAVCSNSVLAVASQMGSGVLLLWGASQLVVGAMSYGTLTAMLQLLSLFRGPALGISGQWTRLTNVEVAGERLQELMAVEQSAGSVRQALPRVRAVVFENVTFCYPGDDTPVLQNLNARFELEQWACLTGISGKGKSTMFKLILGLYTPQEGSVFLETDRGNIPCSEHTRYLFAYVPQDYALFSGTIRENLQLAAPEADEAALRRALHIADADFVWELTAGDGTQVRENNTGLSKGQLQRIAIARAVLMGRQIFLLDECTSALDAQAEDAVLHNLQQLGAQAILVTHRPQALESLDGVSFVAMDT